MAQSPRFKVFTEQGEYVASAKTPTIAAMVVSGLGGGTIRDGHGPIVWTDGKDGDAGESYDVVEDIVWSRIRARSHARYAEYRENGTISAEEYERLTAN